jgi:hypothetical protein
VYIIYILYLWVNMVGIYVMHKVVLGPIYYFDSSVQKLIKRQKRHGRHVFPCCLLTVVDSVLWAVVFEEEEGHRGDRGAQSWLIKIH